MRALTRKLTNYLTLSRLYAFSPRPPYGVQLPEGRESDQPRILENVNIVQVFTFYAFFAMVSLGQLAQLAEKKHAKAQRPQARCVCGSAGAWLVVDDHGL